LNATTGCNFLILFLNNCFIFISPHGGALGTLQPLAHQRDETRSCDISDCHSLHAGNKSAPVNENSNPFHPSRHKAGYHAPFLASGMFSSRRPFQLLNARITHPSVKQLYRVPVDAIPHLPDVHLALLPAHVTLYDNTNYHIASFSVSSLRL
jgi:hypothetical protein